jgi:hypothetical protein
LFAFAAAVLTLLAAPEPARAVPSFLPTDLDLAPARLSCREALELGKTKQARDACKTALMLGGGLEDMRNHVAALMAGNPPPSMQDLVMASLVADGEIHKAPMQPWGYLARCDIARRLGDRDALDLCRADLERVAPGSAQAKLAAVPASHAPLMTWVGRLLVAAVFGLTLLDVLARRWRSRPGGRSAAALTVAVAVLLLAGTARAETKEGSDHLSEFEIDDLHPETSIPTVEQQNKKPLEFGYFMQDMLVKADAATKRGDHMAAARYYAALTKAVPNRAYAFGATCASLASAGQIDKAIAACRQALIREGVTVGNYELFVRLMLSKPGTLSADERKEVDDVVAHLSQQPDVGVVPQQLACEVAVHNHDVPGLETCTAALAKTAPNDAKTISYQWALAIEKRDRKQARDLIDRARAAGMAKEGLAKMEQATGSLGGFPRSALMWAVGVALALGIVAIGTRRMLASR